MVEVAGFAVTTGFGCTTGWDRFGCVDSQLIITYRRYEARSDRCAHDRRSFCAEENPLDPGACMGGKRDETCRPQIEVCSDAARGADGIAHHFTVHVESLRAPQVHQLVDVAPRGRRGRHNHPPPRPVVRVGGRHQ